MASFLVVDDDPALRTMFGRALAEMGQVEQADGGRQALALIGTNRYDVILLDLHMPGVDGFAVIEALAKDDCPNREATVFVVTGDTTEQARLRALKMRSLFLLTKPVPLQMIRSLVENATKKGQRPPAAPARGPRKA